MRRPQPVVCPNDKPAMEEAVRAFLVAAGLDPKSHPDLGETPRLVARAWADEFLAGYRTSPAEVLAERMPAPRSRAKELVVLTRVEFQSVCPHHLLPYRGRAHLAYLPGRSLVGFGQLVHLLDCLAQRLVLQEDLARQVADALCQEIGARGAAVLLEADQACLALRGGKRPGSLATAEAYAGLLARDAELRARFLSAVRS